MLARILRVHGDSLTPAVRDGDFVLVVGPPLVRPCRLRPGDLVVFRRAGYGTLIKRIAKVLGDGAAFEVVGLDGQSIDSREFGPVDAADVVGRIVWRSGGGGREN